MLVLKGQVYQGVSYSWNNYCGNFKNSGAQKLWVINECLPFEGKHNDYPILEHTCA